MDAERARSRVVGAPVGHLATVTADDRPHVVPCCFALDGERIVTAVDAKPKSTGKLRRLENISANPHVTVLVDHYDDDWSTLWWVRLDGEAKVFETGPEREQALALLAAKYRQYRVTAPPGPVIGVEITRWRSWP